MSICTHCKGTGFENHPTEVILLASASKLKEDSIRMANWQSNNPLVLKVDRGPSFNQSLGLPEQPFGLDKIIRCSQTRFNFILNNSVTNFVNYLIAIESGLVRLDDSFSFGETASIVLGRLDNNYKLEKQVNVLSPIIMLPKYIGEDLAAYINEFGEDNIPNLKCFIEERYHCELGEKDTIKFFTNGAVTRREILAQTINLAIDLL